MPTDSLRDAVLSHLPGWVPWAVPALWILATFLVTWLVCTIADKSSLRPYLRERPEHWTEKARLLFPARRSALAMTLLCVGLPVAMALDFHGPLTPVSLRWIGAGIAVAGFAGAFVGLGRAERIVHGEEDSLPARLRTVAMSYLLFYTGLPVFALTILAMPRYWGMDAALVLVLGIALHQLLIRGGSAWILRRLGVVREASPELEAMVEELAELTGAASVPPVYELRVLQANAMVIPQSKTIFVTEAMLKALSPAEVRAVLAHEFGHILESAKITNLRTVRGSLILLLAATFPVMYSYGFVLAILTAIVPVALALVTARFIRDLEERADEVGKEHEGEPGTYARALEGLYRRNLMPAVMNGSGKTHPHLYDRMLAAGYEPEYPRPEPPPSHSLRSAPLLAIIVFVIAGMSAHELLQRIEDRPWDEGEGYVNAIAATGGHPWLLMALGEHWLDAADQAPPEIEPASGASRADAAWDLMTYANELSDDAYLHIHFAEELIAAGKEREARTALDASRADEEDWERPARAADRGMIYLDLGDPQAAAGELAVIESAPPDATENDAWTSVRTAFLHRAVGNRERAETWLAQAREIGERGGYLDHIENHITSLLTQESER